MKFLLIVFFVLGFGVAEAQELSLQQCIDIALDKNFDMRIQKNTLDKAEYDVWKSYQGIIPIVNLNAQGGTFKQGPTVYIGESPAGIDSTTGSVIYEQQEISKDAFSRKYNSLSLSVNWTIFDGMATYYSVRQSTVLKDAAKADLQSRINSTVQQVRSAYFEVLKYQKLVEARQLAVERSTEQLKKQVLAFQIGSATRLDTLKARVSYNTDRINLITGKNGLKTARYNLNVVLGRDPSQEIKVKDIDESKIPVLNSFEELRQMVLAKNPALKSSEYAMKAADYGNTNYMLSPFLPSISVGYRYSRDNEDANKVFFSEYDKHWSYTLGWSMSWNLFNGFGDYINCQKSKIDEINANIQYEKTKNGILNNLQVAYNNYRDALDVININKVNLESAQEDYRLASEKKAVGSATILEVIDSQVSLSSAEQSLVEAYFTALKARAQIDELIGTQSKIVTERN